LSTFTNDEIVEGKKHLINHWRRDPNKPVVMPYRPGSPSTAKKGSAGQFKIDIADVGSAEINQDVAPSDHKTPAKNAKHDPSKELLPKTRGAGGIWLNSSDFPCAF
jgi:hypothetical protein